MRRWSFREGAFAAARVLLCGALGLIVLAWAPASPELLASARADEFVDACGTQGGPSSIFTGSETSGIATTNDCGNISGYNLGLQNDGVNQISPGNLSSLIAAAPPGLEIVQARVPAVSLQDIEGTGYLAYFFWGSGSQRVVPGSTYFQVTPDPPATAFGFYLECNPLGTTCPADGAYIGMNQVVLLVQETVDPTIVAGGPWNLWNQGSRWLRGGWPLSFYATDPSGIHAMSADVNGVPIVTPLDQSPPGCWPGDIGPVETAWQQCANAQTWSPTVSLSGSGHEQLTLRVISAAGMGSAPSETINVDTTPPTVSLSGPTLASMASGTQYVTATATVGPSGLGSINCAVDGAPAQPYSTSPASIPVSGLGMHSVQCTASNRSYNSAGQVAVSTPASWSLDIAQPTVSGISFAKVVGGVKCRRVAEHVKVRAHWVAVDRHGDIVQVRRRARTRVVKVIKCHPRFVTRRITVWVSVKRHGKTVRVKRRKVVRVVVVPHVVGKASRRVAFGQGTTVSGWLGTSNYTALGGRTVRVMTAPDNASGDWTQAAFVTTGADGTWSVQLGAGPSRLVEATYAGDTTTEPSTSSLIHLIVPARVKLRIRPRRVGWGRTIRISGRVLGGFIPPGKLLRLRIGVEGVRETVGIPSIQANGRFHTTWKFASGNGVVRYWFSISTLNEADYPFAPASSRRVYVRVGPG